MPACARQNLVFELKKPRQRAEIPPGLAPEAPHPRAFESRNSHARQRSMH